MSQQGGRTALRRRASGLAVLAVAALAVGCTPEPRPTPPSPSSVTASPAPVRTPAPTPTPVAVDPLPEGPATFLLVGTDSRTPGDLTGNADTIMVVHVPAERSPVYLVSFTRDMWVPIPGVGEGKINSAFPRGGTDLLRRTVSDLLEGTEVHYVLQSNFEGFIALTRALDGFEVENKHASTVRVLSTGRTLEFPTGTITLTNTDALIYVRERKSLPLGDLDRTERQRAAVIGMMEKVGDSADDPEVFADLVAMLVRNVKVTGEMDVTGAIALKPLLQELDRDDVVSLMAPITGFGTEGGASVNRTDTEQMRALGNAMRADEMDRYVQEHGTDYAP